MSMIIFLYGQDTYRMREKLKEIIRHYKEVHKSGLNLDYFDCQKKSDGEIFNDFKNGIRQTSMFKEKKLAVITNPFSDSGFKEKFLKDAKDFLKSEDIILLYQEGKIKENDTLFKFLKKNTKFQEFNLLEGQELKAWIKKEFEEFKTPHHPASAGGAGQAKIEPKALEMLVEYIGNDLWRMANEIKKLVSFKPKQIIKAEDVRILVRSKIETDIFKTIDAIAQKNKRQALNLLQKHLEKGDSPLYLLTMINYQFRNLLIIKDFIEKHKPYNLILKKSGLHPFVVKKSYYQSQKFSFQELKKIYQKIFQVDIDIKTGRVEPEIALDLLIAEI